MIREEVFKSAMSETLALLNATVSGKQAMIDAMYDRLKDNFIEQDLKHACDELLNPEKDFHKFSYPVLIKAMSKARSFRHERESEEKKNKFEQDARKFWKADYNATCTTRRCDVCPNAAGRCDTIAKSTIDAIKTMLSGKWRAKGYKETIEEYYRDVMKGQAERNKAIIAELARQFPGVGFDNDFSAMFKKTITREEAAGYKKPVLKLVKPDYADNDFIPEIDE